MLVISTFTQQQNETWFSQEIPLITYLYLLFIPKVQMRKNRVIGS